MNKVGRLYDYLEEKLTWLNQWSRNWCRAEPTPAYGSESRTETEGPKPSLNIQKEAIVIHNCIRRHLAMTTI